MPFTAPSWVPELPPIPDSISVERFMFDESCGRTPLSKSKAPFTDGASGKTYSALEVKKRVDHLSRALSKELGFKADSGSEWDKVVACFSLNTIDYLTLAWAVHRLGGILTCVNAAYSADELEYQLKDSGAKAIFTCLPLLETTMTASKKVGINKDKIYLMEMDKSFTGGAKNPGHKTLDDFVKAGASLPFFEPADSKWGPGEGKTRIAFLCYSSGTSGLPKGVMIAHSNVIANTIQICNHESLDREDIKKKLGVSEYTEYALGLLPLSHIYGLVVVAHSRLYRGDGVIVLPKYDFKQLLQVIQDFKIVMLYLVPPMIIHLTKSREIVKQYDLSSVRACFTGAAPLGKETAEDLLSIFPTWAVRQGYGLTETCTVVCMTMPHDIWFGSSGSLLAGITARVVDPEGKEITEYNVPGELCVKSPSVVPGYLRNKKANDETFVELDDGRYMKTGDEVMIGKSPQGFEHVTITDRIKEYVRPPP